MKRFAWIAVLVAAVAFGAGSFVAPVRANGVPQLVKLTYLEGVSNYGPRDAEGVLEFSFAEAYARVEVKNLPPTEGVTYEGWMIAPDGSGFWIGEIPVEPSGVGAYETRLIGLTRYDYNLFVIAARTADSPVDRVPETRSIAGRFAVIGDDPDGGAGADVRPSRLPDTGESSPGWPWGRIITTAAVTVGTGLIVIGMRRRKGAA